MTAVSSIPTSTFAFDRPAHVGETRLAVRDLDLIVRYYEQMIGLGVLERGEHGAVLGAGGQPLLHLQSGKDVRPAPQRSSGLFHTAFLMPDRQALGRWLVHAAHSGVRLDGAADHLVSEAIYLSDPEGNGIEIYADRPHGRWSYGADGTVAMDTLPFDLQALYDETPKDRFGGMDDRVAIGHLHLKVGNLPDADAFFENVLGLRKMCTYPGASFYATGGYHHHVAANIWQSRGTGAREANQAGLSRYSLHFNDRTAFEGVKNALDTLEIPTVREGNAVRFTDPWGMDVVLTA
ncbi:VOC family protein [Gellertiella hungarica]|uniref:Catechol 2,3-dioxygenase n=1 Tax=Gellertiella hungarica TaxID=1572859 RepID=A0A7W6NJQ2_9HYPH|nr:VOC family protein [Gellertiella hungarica]MBB4063517.1 catechol 2,3-dioxygenase [Gellertiella hungarica]